MLDDAVGLEVRRATGKVPAKDVDDERRDDEDVHALEGEDGERHGERVARVEQERHRELDHRGVNETTQSSDILRVLGMMTRSRSRSRYLGDERVFKCWLLGARERRQIRAEIVDHRETAATSG